MFIRTIEQYDVTYDTLNMARCLCLNFFILNVKCILYYGTFFAKAIEEILYQSRKCKNPSRSDTLRQLQKKTLITWAIPATNIHLEKI